MMIGWRCRVAPVLSVIAACLIGSGQAPCRADDFPSRPVRIIAPFAAGGSLDVVARLVAEKLSATWSQPVVVENRPGANGIIGVDGFAKSPPDGYTLLIGTSPVFTTNKLLYKDLAYDPDRDFIPVSLAAVAPNVLGIYPSLPINDLHDLIAYARAHPGALTFASQGNGSTGQLSAMLLDQLANIDMKHVPYRGASLAWNDVIGGHVDMMWDGIPSILSQIRAGTIRALAVGSRQRSAALPDVPTAIEQGLPDFESESWFAFAVLHGTPEPIVQALSRAISAAVHAPDVSAHIVDMGARPVGSTPEEMTAAITTTTALWKRVIETANVRIE
jgi:tripartite-type tricarboxylate transporter receptor subunit TctC